ncbi:LacI family DNA-binding transcriptional regulator [Ligilactobacillus sp. WILCCON 0076]|uniref:LacI family DNA-binding transcriptional regulator n=1 Tax=Ligilactobacillus ubinensis TaxID=2876789 RepID=A0A9X2FMZ3_9LACO|nr:LacI family DNA-binding transcriptional regulator [Ligilactobacillus ubinensis]MCP0887088.1 LacI family DNA-binding transcriptional regulator [Ligilactobacillus ubinensis]
MATIEDIAKLAGVAKSTVSRYLNGGYVSEKTKFKIERIIQEQHYTPNAFARSLKAKKTYIIGTIIARLDSSSLSQVLRGLDQQLQDAKYQLIIANTNESQTREIQSMINLAHQKVDGIVLLATRITPKHLKIIKEIDVPVLVVGQECDTTYNLLNANEEAAFALSKSILMHNYKNIAYIGVSEDDHAVGRDRKMGFQRALKKFRSCNVEYYETSFNANDAKKVALENFSSKWPDLVVCATDNIAFGIITAAQEMGVAVPKKVSVTGFGGYQIGQLLHPKLVTVDLHFFETGRKAGEMMINILQNKQEEKKVIMAYSIIYGESVDKKF